MSGYSGSTTPIEHRDCWRTPAYIVRYAEHILGGIDFDTACTSENAVTTPIWLGTGDCDSLAVDWQGRCWCNPPYSLISPWAEKAIGSNAVTAFLIPTPNGESYYSELFKHSHEISIIGRISFIGADGKPKSGNNRGSSLFIVNGYAQGTRSFVHREELIAKYGKAVQT